MSGKDIKRSQAARLGHLRRELGQPGALEKIALGLANAQVTVFARLVSIQRARLEAHPPEDGETLCQWLADVEALWELYPKMRLDSQTHSDLIPTIEECKRLAEGPLQDLHDRAAAMGATVNLADRGRCQTFRGWRRAMEEASHES